MKRSPVPMRRLEATLRPVLAASVIALAICGPRLAHANEAGGGRSDPANTPRAVPDFAVQRTSPGLPQPDAAAPPPAGGANDYAVTLGDVQVTGEVSGGTARSSRRWRAPSGAKDDLNLEIGRHERLDASWVHRQFVRNHLIGSPTTPGRVLALVLLINQAYAQNGYINSGLLFMPADWSHPGAVLRLELVSGRVVPAHARGAPFTVAWTHGKGRGLRASYIRDRMPSATEVPLNAIALEHDFRLLAEDPAIKTINAQLTPGSAPGAAVLALSVDPQPRVDVYASVSNSRSPSVGGMRYSGGMNLRNALFSGDALSVEGGETRGLADGYVSYSTPIFLPETYVDVRALDNQAAVVDQTLRLLGIRSDENSVEAGITHRFIDQPLTPNPDGAGWMPAETLSLGARLATHHTYSSLLGSPFSFGPGAVDGVSISNVVRLTTDYVLRSERQVVALTGTFSYGISGTGSDVPGVVTPDPHFNAILFQANYARRLTSGGLELRARVTAQRASSVLYAAEQLSAGGQDTVRGYRENLILADSGVIASAELDCPVTLGRLGCVTRADDWRTIRLSVFSDGAYTRNHAGPQPSPNALASLGVGVTWSPSDLLYARFSYGGALIPAHQTGPRDIQDDGIQFLVTLHPLDALRLLK